MTKWLIVPIQSTTTPAEALSARPNEHMGTHTVNIRRTAAAAIAGLALAGGAALAPAAAAPSGGTVVTFALGGSALAITTPANPAPVAGSVAAASQVTSDLGTTTVTDNSGTLLGWTVTATATNLVHSADAAITIPKAAMRFDTLSLTAGAGGSLTNLVSGAAVVTPGTGGPFLSAAGVDVPVLVAKALPLAGAGSYNVTGRITLTVPPATQAGTYTATVTQTVS